LVSALRAAIDGDFGVRVPLTKRHGTMREFAEAFNELLERNATLARELVRVERTVGRDGRLDERVSMGEVHGGWATSVGAVNALIGDLVRPTVEVARVIGAVAAGDLSQKMALRMDDQPLRGEFLLIGETVNGMVDQLRAFAGEVTRVAKEVGSEGKLGGQAQVSGVSGTWKDLTDNVNSMASNLTAQVRNIALVTTAVANGDLSKKITVDVKGEILELKNTINTMVDQLNSFASEVTRVAREVSVEGKLGGQASVPGVAGTWKDLTDNVNFMARNLTTQVRGIVKVVTAVANGDLSQKLVGVEAKGEIAALADTINNMCDTLGTFADQVSTVAREVGIEGKLGGQAKVPGAMGTWRQLTDNVNQLAANLTGQVRAISEVATAVTKGDLTRSIDVQAQGEVALLKDNINQMILNLKETTQKNTEQDWLKTNLAKFSGMMQGQKSLEAVSDMIMSELTPLVSAHHGAFFMLDVDVHMPTLKLTSTYAYRERKHVANAFRFGEGLVGQCAREKKPILLTRVPADYIQISSGLGEAPPLNIIVLPVLFEGQVKAVIELASFHSFSAIHQLFLDQLMVSIGVVLNMITANMRTEQLLLQSQGLTQELQSQSKELQLQQQELRRTNLALEKQALELEEKARLLAEQNEKVEIKNSEVEQARRSLEEKAEQLALASKYKSEFLANMSHELRTPLNSLLILARLLTDNADANLSQAQVEYARTIYTCGTDLLSLINEILDLSKVEAGKMQVEPRAVLLGDLVRDLRRSFQPVADQKELRWTTEVVPGTSETVFTDPHRLQQILKNLLSNAFKFTDRGAVTLRVGVAQNVSGLESESLRRASRLIALDVSDTGIGIPADKQRLIFEAFQQADGTTSRRYGGTGLGLSISREIARLLGGEIRVRSTPGQGSTFTLYLPELYDPPGTVSMSTRPAREAPMPVLPIDPAGELVPELARKAIEDDRTTIMPGDRVLLVIEDDENFSRILIAIGRQQGFKVVVAARGDTGLALAAQLRPSAITLDIHLPVYDGWTVLDRLKRNSSTRHIPVQVISIMERGEGGAAVGAFAYLEKPVTKDALDGAFAHLRSFVDRTIRVLLLVEDNETDQTTIRRHVGELGDVDIVAVRSAEEALSQLEQRAFDCMLVDLVLPGLDGVALVADVKRREAFKDLPIVVYTGKDLDPEEEHKLKKLASSVIVKSGLESLDRLGTNLSLFLHRARAGGQELPDGALDGKTVLLVDDDARNVFALSSALEAGGLRVLYAEDGRAAIDSLGRHDKIDIVLMDIMMPQLDGYATIRAIRQNPKYVSLPIIALTAKALTEDREKCVAAGATDYVPKPVDVRMLLERIHHWTNDRAGFAGDVE
jgi:signal transduction histidine kinase/DNA-binding response OmpR family regulator/HAMP domain-containing protein